MGKDLFSFGRGRNIQLGLGPKEPVEKVGSGSFHVISEESGFSRPGGKRKRALSFKTMGGPHREANLNEMTGAIPNTVVWKYLRDLLEAL